MKGITSHGTSVSRELVLGSQEDSPNPMFLRVKMKREKKKKKIAGF